MKTNKTILTGSIILGATVSLLIGQQTPPPGGQQRPPQQQQGGRPPGGSQSGPVGQQPGGQSGGQSSQRMQPPSFPLVQALDVNRNHVIESNEIANAVSSLQR